MSLALWLRAGRAQKGLSLEDVAKITKIQPRILERLEAGKLDGLPAEVFVRGFIRSVAKCVGLDESEALVRYSAAQGSPTTIPTATASAVAFVESMADLAPATSNLLAPVVLVNNPPAWPASSNEGLPAITDEIDDVEIDVDVDVAPIEAKVDVVVPATIEVAPVVETKIEVVEVAPVVETKIEVVEVAPVVETKIEVVEVAPVVETNIVDDTALVAAEAPVEVPTGKKKRTRKPRGTNAPKGKRKAMATGTPSSAMPIVADSAAVTAVVETPAVAEAVVETAPNVASVATRPVVATAVDETAPVVETLVATAPVVGTVVQAAPVVATAPVVGTVVQAAPVVATARVVGTVVQAAPVVAVGTAPVIAPITAADELFGAATATMIDTTELADATTADAMTADATTADATTVDATSEATSVEATTTDATTTDATTTDASDEPATSGTWKPSMPTVTTSSVPWRRPSLGIYATSTAPVVPTLVIDDADPESAASQQEDRAQAHMPRRSFLPPILAERAKHGASGQGTLTLAVIILLIAATLTLSYLMRRPSSSGDGVTRADGTIELVG